MSADLSHLSHVPVYLIIEHRGARGELLSDGVLAVGMFNEDGATLSARITELVASHAPDADWDSLELRHSADGSQVFAVVEVPQRPISRTVKHVEHDDAGRIAAIHEETYRQ